jgi:hypothetical protein
MIVTPEEIEGLRKLLDPYPEEERLIFARAAAEFLRLHDAVQRLYDLSADDVRHETDQFECDVHAGTIAGIVERTARRFLEPQPASQKADKQ